MMEYEIIGNSSFNDLGIRCVKIEGTLYICIRDVLIVMAKYYPGAISNMQWILDREIVHLSYPTKYRYGYKNNRVCFFSKLGFEKAFQIMRCKTEHQYDVYEKIISCFKKEAKRRIVPDTIYKIQKKFTKE